MIFNIFERVKKLEENNESLNKILSYIGEYCIKFKTGYLWIPFNNNNIQAQKNNCIKVDNKWYGKNDLIIYSSIYRKQRKQIINKMKKENK